jgi:hypothetical protein
MKTLSIKKLVITGLTTLLFSGMTYGLPTNTDFESGSLSPWYQDVSYSDGTDWEISSSAIGGSYSAFNIGNKRIRQDFSAIDTNDITSITFNLLTEGHSFNAYNFFYSDNTSPEYGFSGTENTVQLVDITANLLANKFLVGFGLYGNTGGSTFFDNFSIVTNSSNSVPAPTSIALLGLGLISLAWTRRKKA